MTKITHDKLNVKKTAHVYTYGNSTTAKVAVLLCHGYGQLADRIIKKFSNINEADIYVVSPEGLNTFYWEGVTGEPVATWMTKRNRLDEIVDFSAFLSQVYSKYFDGFEGKIVFMGFSQGCTTIWRWIHREPHRFDYLINWAGWIPEDIALSNVLDNLPNTKIRAVLGNQDEYLSEDRIKALKNIIDKNNLPVEYTTYEGKHIIDRQVLEKIIKEIY